MSHFNNYEINHIRNISAFSIDSLNPKQQLTTTKTFINFLTSSNNNNPLKTQDNNIHTTTPTKEEENLLFHYLPSISVHYNNNNYENNNYLINIINCQQQFNNFYNQNNYDDIDSSIKLIDGAILIIDGSIPIEIYFNKIEKLLRQLIMERIKPILIINLNLEKVILKYKLNSEQFYLNLFQLVTQINTIIQTYSSSSITKNNNLNTTDNEIIEINKEDDFLIHPDKIIFTNFNSMKEEENNCWGFTLRDFKEFGEEELLWDKNSFYHTINNCWINKKFIDNDDLIDKNNEVIKRPFCHFILDPIYKIYETISDNNNYNNENNSLNRLLKELDIFITKIEFNELTEINKLIYVIVNKWLSTISLQSSTTLQSDLQLKFREILLQEIILNLPSPKDFSKEKVKHFYTGPLNDKYGNAIANCDENGPLMVYISNLFTIPHHFFLQNSTILQNTTCIQNENTKTLQKDIVIAFGKIFSGKIKSGMTIKILGNSYQVGKKEDLFIKQILNNDLFTTISTNNLKIVNELSCGNLIYLKGIDSYILKSCTITNLYNNDTIICDNDVNIDNSDIINKEISEPVFPFKHFAIPPISQNFIHVTVEPKNLQNLPQLIEGMKSLSKNFQTLQNNNSLTIIGKNQFFTNYCKIQTCCSIIEETGEKIVSSNDPFTLQYLIKNLKEYCKEIELQFSEPIVSLKETITKENERTILVKSPNRLNRFYLSGEPLDSLLQKDISNSFSNLYFDYSSNYNNLQNNLHITNINDHFYFNSCHQEIITKQCDYLNNTNHHNLNPKKIWTFGPESLYDPNLLINEITGRPCYLNEIKENICKGFHLAIHEGALINEPIRGMKINILDLVCISDCIHRGAGQVIPSFKRGVHACQVFGEPRLMEPIFQMEFTCFEYLLSDIYFMLNNKQLTTMVDNNVYNGTVDNIVDKSCDDILMNNSGFRDCFVEKVVSMSGTPLCYVKLLIPVMEFYSFKKELEKLKVYDINYSFNSWKVINGNPYENGFVKDLILKIRKRKGLPEKIPTVTDLEDYNK